MISAGGKTSVVLSAHHRHRLFKTTIISKFCEAQLNLEMTVIVLRYKKPAQQNLYHAYTILVYIFLMIRKTFCKQV